MCLHVVEKIVMYEDSSVFCYIDILLTNTLTNFKGNYSKESDGSFILVHFYQLSDFLTEHDSTCSAHFKLWTVYLRSSLRIR